MQEPNVPHHFDRRPNDYPRRKTPTHGWRDDNGKPIHAIDDEGNPICGRRCSLTGKPCERKDQHIQPNGRCTSIGHGGHAPGGPLKHGRYSMFLPTRLAATFEEASEGDVLHSNRANMAVLVAMTKEKMAEMDEGSDAELWSQAKQAFAELQYANSSLEPGAVKLAMSKLAATLNNGAGAEKRARQVIDLMETNGRLTKVEMIRVHRMGQYMTAKEMIVHQAHVIHVLKKYVDEATLTKVSTELGVSDYV